MYINGLWAKIDYFFKKSNVEKWCTLFYTRSQPLTGYNIRGYIKDFVE